MAKTCKIIRNQNGSPIGVADSNGNPSRVFKQILQIPFLRNFDEAVNTYTYLKGEIPTLDEVTQQLQKTGLASNVRVLTSNQIEQELVKRGVDAKLAKQVSVWHGSPHLFDKFSLSAMGTGEGAQAFGWGMYFTDLESIAKDYADKLRPNVLLIDGKTYDEVRDEIDNPVISWIETYVRDGLNKEQIITKLNDQLKDKEWLSKNTWVEKNIKEALAYIKDKTIEEDKSNRNLYKTTLHKGKQPSEYTWLEWDKPLTNEQKELLFNSVSYSSLRGEIHNIKISDRFDADSFDGGLTYRVGDTTKMGQSDEFTNTVYDTLEEAEKEARRLNFLDTNISGKDLYEALAKEVGQKQASLFLLENGIDGIKYPAESISRGATSDTARGFNYVVFDENVVTIEEVIQFQKAGLGLLPNGFVDLKTKEVFLNQETANLDTPIHEFSHLFTNILKQTNPQLYQRGLELIEKEGKEYIDFVKQNQPNLEGEALLEEALTQAVGEAGEKIINKQSKFFQWLQDMWNSLKDMIGLTQYSWNEVKDMNLQQFTEAMAVDLLRGEELRPSPILSTEQELEQIKAQAIADGTFMKAPNGKPTNLTERQWLQVRSKAFKDWFGDWINDPENASKVVDENNEPLVVYHASNQNITIFDREKSKREDFSGFLKDIYGTTKNIAKGTYFTPTKEVVTKGFRRDFIIPVFLNIRNTVELDFKGNMPTDVDSFEKASSKFLVTAAGQAIEKDELDGFILRNAPEYGTISIPDKDQYIVYQPNQIKSATDNVGTFSAQSDDIRYQIIGEQNAGLAPNRDVQVYITPATVRNFNEETLRLKELTDEYNNAAKEISQGNLENQEKFTNLQHKILDAYQEHIKEKVSKIRGVNVSFNQPYLGSWQGNYEPSLNMTLSISPNADTGAISGLLFDLAENTSQDAFILEERSEIEDRTPLTEFDEAGMMHYPQIRVNFNSQLSVAEKSIIAQRLKNNGVEEFSIDGDYFIVSIIDFNSETNEQKEQYYAEKTTAITTLFTGEGGKIGTNKVRDVQENFRKSKYVGARNEGDEQSQTREYDRSDLFEAQSPNIRYQISGERGINNLEDRIEVARRLKNLETAKEMYALGISPLRIKQATEWEINPIDKKWRYEIADGNIKLSSFEINKEYPISEVIEGTEYVEMYPDVKVKIIDDEQVRLAGVYNTQTKTIEINANFEEWSSLKEGDFLGVSSRLRQTLLHEMAHAAQNIENFAGGGSPKVIIDETIRRLGITPDDSKELSKDKAERVLSNPESSRTDKILAQYMLDVLASNSKKAAVEVAESYYSRIVGEAEANAVVNRSREENAFEDLFPGNRLQSLIYESGDVAIEDQIYFENVYPEVVELFRGDSYQIIGEQGAQNLDQAEDVPNNVSLQFRDKDGNVYNSLKEMFDNNVEDFKIGIEHEGKFVSAIEAQINPNPQTVNGLIMSLIKDGLISDKATMDTNGEILLVPTGESDLKKAITSDMARGVAKGYHGNIFKIGKDFNIRIAEQEKAKDSHDKTFQQLKKEVGEEEALARKTMQEYNKFIGESNRGTTNLDFSLLPDNELVTKLLAYLNKIGVQTTSIEQYVKQYKLKNGVHPDAQALADLSNNIVAFKDGIITEAELIEEVSHFIVDAMNPQERSNMMSNIHRTREWGEYAQTYYDVYSQQGLSGQALEDAVREEILGKVLANSLKENFQRAQEQTIEGGIVSRLMEAFQEFFQRIKNFFQDSYQAELERYTFNVYENLMNETLPSEQRQRGESKLTLYSTNTVTPLQKATKSWLETLNATQRELKGKYKLSSSSNTLARQIRNLQGEINDATYKNAVADLLSVTNSQINLVDREVTRALKEGTYFPQEIKGAYESIRTSLFPIISQVKGRLGEKDTQLKKEIEKTVQNISDLIDKVPQVNRKALDNILERVFRQNNFTQEEADKYREQVEKVLKSAEYDTSWFHAHLGGLLQARNPLLNLLGDVIEQMKFRERQLLHPVLKTLMSKLEASGFDILQLKKLIYKNEIINEVDPDKVKKLENSIKAKYYNQFVLEGERATEETVEDKISKIQDEINKLTNEIENESKLFTVDEINLKQTQRTEKTLILSQIDKAFRKDLNKQKFISMIDPKYLEDRDKFAIEVNGQIISREKGIIPGIAPEETQVYIDEFNQLSRQIWEIKSLADGGALTKSEQKEIRDIEARRRQLMNPRQLDGTLKPGVVETWSVVKNLKDSTESKVFTYSFDPNMTYDGSTKVSIEQRAEALRIVAFQNLTLLSQKFSASQKGERNGIPQEFIDSLNSLQTEQEKWDFLMNNSTISFPQEFWDSFDPNESLVARLIALKNGDNDVEIDKVVNRIRSNQAKISNIIKSNRDFFNPAETNVEDFFQQTEVKDAQTELDKAKSDARKFFPEGTQFESSEGVDITANESYLKQLSDLGITNSGKELSSEVDAEFNFARKHMTPRSEDAIISLRNIIKRLKNGETVSKSYFTEQVIGSRTDYDNILREEIRKRLLPYYKRTEPSGYSQALEQLKQGVENNTPNAVLNFMESGLVDVKPSNAFYDTTSRLNPEWVANRDAGREQYTSDYLKKVRNDEYFNRYNPDKDGNATTNIAEFKAREAWLEANDQAIEMYGLTGLMSRYQIPQQHKTVIRRLITSKGKPKAIGEILRDATTIREDDMELGQNIFGEKARKGDAFLTVPRYGVNKLKNQEDVSDEILHSLVWFTQQAALYKARKESISEALALRDFIINTKDYADKSNKASNTYKMADSFINANFYGVKETFSYEMDIPFLGKIDIGKIARTFNSWVRFSNLAGVTVPLTSMFQGKIQEAIEAIAKESTSPTAYKLAQNKVRKLMSGAAGEIMGFHSKSELNSKLEILGVYNMLDRFNNSALNKGWRTVLAANNGLHQLGNAPVTSTAAFSIVLDYRVVDGRIMTERQYKSIFKNAKDWETYPLFDNFWKIDENGNSKIDKDGLKKALNITNEQEVDRIANDTLESISKRALALVQRVDTQIPEHQKSLASRNAIANFFLMHMNWFLVAIPNKTKFKHNNLSEGGMVQEGNWRTVLNMVSKMVQNPKQIREIWNDAKTDDVQKRAIRRTVAELSVGNALAIAAIMLANAVDDDDDPAYLLTWADYMLTRVSVEQVSGTIALPQQVDNILESPIVAYQKFKDLRELPNLVFGSGEITQGYYSGYTKRQRAAMKTLPYFKEFRRMSDFTRERQMYAHFNLNEDKIFSRYAWLSNLAVEELEDE